MSKGAGICPQDPGVKSMSQEEITIREIFSVIDISIDDIVNGVIVREIDNIDTTFHNEKQPDVIRDNVYTSTQLIMREVDNE